MTPPIFDGHLHLRPDGRGAEAMEDFHRAGGTHALLVHTPYSSMPISCPEDFRESYEVTLRLADAVNASRAARVFVTVGPYPVLLLGLVEIYGLEKGVEIMKGGMDAAQRLVLDGRAVAIGEIGRPHFPVDDEILEASNDILSYGMGLARDASCPVVLHTESATPETMGELARMADRAGIPRDMVVKHYSAPLVRPDENHGLIPSVLASRQAVRVALSKGDRFMMETDFLDDPSRPGAVMDVTTVPKRTRAFLASGELAEDAAWRIHKELPEKTYGIIIESP